MNRFSQSLLLIAMLLPSVALAQLKPAPSPTATRAATAPAPTDTRPVTLPPPAKPASEDDKQAAEDARLRERLSRPAFGAPPPARPKTVKPPVQAPATVYDAHGRQLNGMRQAGPNRVLDTRTGRYYNTVPSGTGQRIVP